MEKSKRNSFKDDSDERKNNSNEKYFKHPTLI